MIIYFLSFTGALVTALAATPIVRRWALAYDVVDRPDNGRKQQKAPVPLLGGVAVLAAWLTTMAVAQTSGIFTGEQPWALAVSLTLLCLLGVADGLWRIRVRWKLLAQIAAALPLVAAGGLVDRCQVLGVEVHLGVWAAPLAMLWYAASINAFNFIDGMDGLAATCGICISLCVAALVGSSGDVTGAVSGLALAGALGGFLVFNAPPARIYLGDAGSMVVGLLLAWQVLNVASVQARVPEVSVMLLFMAVPMLDLLLAIARRTLVGKHIWDPDRGHMHHRLLDRFGNVPAVLATLAAVCVFYNALAAWALWRGWWPIMVAVAGTAMLVRLQVLGDRELSLLGQALAVWSRGRAPATESVWHMPPPASVVLPADSWRSQWPTIARRARVAPMSTSRATDWSPTNSATKPWGLQFRVPSSAATGTAKLPGNSQPVARSHASSLFDLLRRLALRQIQQQPTTLEVTDSSSTDDASEPSIIPLPIVNRPLSRRAA